jgi:hypothetical protein
MISFMLILMDPKTRRPSFSIKQYLKKKKTCLIFGLIQFKIIMLNIALIIYKCYNISEVGSTSIISCKN